MNNIIIIIELLFLFFFPFSRDRIIQALSFSSLIRQLFSGIANSIQFLFSLYCVYYSRKLSLKKFSNSIYPRKRNLRDIWFYSILFPFNFTRRTSCGVSKIYALHMAIFILFVSPNLENCLSFIGRTIETNVIAGKKEWTAG